jgi:hypothetical protein
MRFVICDFPPNDEGHSPLLSSTRTVHTTCSGTNCVSLFPIALQTPTVHRHCSLPHEMYTQPVTALNAFVICDCPANCSPVTPSVARPSTPCFLLYTWRPLWPILQLLPLRERKSMFLLLYIIYIYISYLQTRAHSPATLWPNFNAIGALLSELYGPEDDAVKLAVTFLYI